MQAISEYISELLYSHDYVMVPTLGAFVASRVAAQIDTRRGVITPPRKELIFNSNLSYNDGTLSSYIAQTENISFDAANRYVLDEVRKMRNVLNNSGLLMLAGLGTMRAEMGNMHFLADKNLNFLPESYGWAPIAVADLRRANTYTFNTRALRRIAASAAMIAGLLLVSPSIRDAQVPSMNEANLLQSFAPSTTLVAEDENVVAVVAQVTDTKHFYIIVGSFATNSDADRFISNQRSRGTDGLMKLSAGKRIRVAVASFDDYNEAVRQNKIVKTISGFEKAWIYTED